MLSSRSLTTPYRLAIVLFAGFGLSLGAAAQEVPERTAEDVFAGAEVAYGPPPPEPKCEPNDENIIVVCAEEEDQDQFRVKSSSELDPTSEDAIDDGLPRAPDVGGAGIFKGPATVGSLCIPGLQKCPPPPAIMVDFSALPEAPPGSDADRIGRGLAPRGNDTGDAPEVGEDSAETIVPRTTAQEDDGE